MILVLDLDGVIVRSNFLKHDAMLSLIADDHPRREEISQYILAQGGVRRDDKLTYILSVFLGLDVTSELLDTYLQRYAKRLDRLVSLAPLVEGIFELVSTTSSRCFVCSSAPQSEVLQHLDRMKIRQFFQGIHSSDTPKSQALAQIKAGNPGEVVIFFGDALGDEIAAMEAQVAFIGVTAERDNFVGKATVRIPDFASQALVRAAIQAVAAPNAT